MLKLRPCAIVATFAVFSAMIADSLAQSQQPSPRSQPQIKTQNTQQKAAPYNSGTEEAPLIVKVLPGPKTKVETSTEKEEHDEKLSADLWMMRLTGALVFVGLLQLAAFIVQACRLTQTINLMKNTAERQLRAYVSIRNFGRSPIVDTQTNNVNGWALNLVWQNTGQTPTRDMLSHTTIRFEQDEIPGDFRFPDMWMIGQEQTYVPVHLAPNGTFIDGVCPFSVAQLQEVRSGQKTLYLYGWADYNDAFSNTPRHRTEFCARVLLPGDPAYSSEENIAFDIYWKHNGADDECMRAPITSVKRERIPDLPT